MRASWFAGVAIAIALGGSAAAETWPGRSVTVIVPFGAGGNTDMMARLGTEHLTEKFGQPFVVENRPSAGGAVGTGQVATANPDGYTLLFAAASMVLLTPQLQKLTYDPMKQLVPITNIGTGTQTIAVRRDLPVTTLPELIAYAKANPGKLNFGSGSTGSAGHLAGELFKTMAGVEMTHVPYKGAAPAMNDLIGGQIQLMFDNLASSLAQVRAGRIRALAVTTAKRSALAPDLPTIAESGLPGFDISTWFGIFVPANTPPEIVDRLHSEFTRALAMPDIRDKMLALGAEPVGSRPGEFSAYIRTEADKYARVIKASGAKVD
jgi:tripartite-type tricarboxylate transporter receptor subunit TctC